nr:AraC family transcriptional regulator [Atopomonas sediminilitoris]
MNESVVPPSSAPLTHSVTLRRFLFEALAALGFDPGQIYRQAFQGAERNLLLSDGREPHELAPRFWQAIAPLTGDAQIGLHLAEAMQPRALDVAGYLLLSAATLRQGLQALLEYQALLSGGLLARLEVNGAQARLIFDLSYQGMPYLAQQSDCLALLLLKLLQWVSDGRVQVQAVQLRHPAPAQWGEYERLLGCRPHFAAAHDALCFQADVLDKPSRNACPSVFAALQREAQVQLASLVGDLLLQRLRNQLQGQLGTSQAMTLAHSAEALAMPVGALKQALSERGLGFRQVLDGVRRAQVSALLTQAMPFKEVARQLGYAELSPFYRAFRRWYGQTPQVVRQRLKAEV